MNENKTTVFEYNTETLTKQNLESIKKEEPKIESYFLVDGFHEQLSKRLYNFIHIENGINSIEVTNMNTIIKQIIQKEENDKLIAQRKRFGVMRGHGMMYGH